MIILGLLLVGSTTYGQITISNDSIFDNDEFIGRYAVWQRFIHCQNEKVYVNYILTATLATDQKNEVENAIKIKLDKESQTNTNHTYFFNYALPAQDIKKTSLLF